MFTNGCDVYLHIPDELEERVLHAGVVQECAAKAVVAKFNDPVSPAVGATVFLHREANRRFMKQAALVQAVLRASATPVLAFRLDGAPISAESRAVYRVSVAATNLTAVIGASAESCPLQDVSATGLGVISKQSLPVGRVVEAQVCYQGQIYRGRARVQCAIPRTDGRFRYGLLALEDPGKNRSTLGQGLGHITAAVQREQLRRLARA